MAGGGLIDILKSRVSLLQKRKQRFKDIVSAHSKKSSIYLFYLLYDKTERKIPYSVVKFKIIIDYLSVYVLIYSLIIITLFIHNFTLFGRSRSDSLHTVSIHYSVVSTF